MKELLEILKQNNYLEKEIPLEVLDVISAQKELSKHGYPLLPSEFLDFLRVYNGIRGDGFAVLGIEPKDEEIDVVRFNRAHNTSKTKAIIGYDEFCFLAYDTQKSAYLLLDRNDGEELDDFVTLSYALGSILHI